MRRREFLGALSGAAFSWPLAVRAQQSDRIPRIGVLHPHRKDDPRAKARLTAFREGLSKRGWHDRRIHIDYRFAGGRTHLYQALAKELVALKPDVILASTTPIVSALQKETRTIPIVFVSVSDPIGSGFIATLARPAGNITGVMLYEVGIVGKWLALLKEIEPGLMRAAVMGDPKKTPFDYFLQSAKVAAASLRIEIEARPIANVTDMERVIASIAKQPNTGLVVLPEGTSVINRDRIIRLTAQHRVPAIYPWGGFVSIGGLMSYGTDTVDHYRQAAAYVDRILRGDSPADLPVQTPTKYETAVNLKTAKTLGLKVPPSLLVRADRLIE